MDITPLVAKGQQIVKSYSNGVFHISNETYQTAVLLSPEKTTPWGDFIDSSDICLSDFEPIIALTSEYDVFLLGTGKTMKFLDPELKKQLRAEGVVFDMMDTGAACRTYNVLMAEGRRILVAMLPYQ